MKDYGISVLTQYQMEVFGTHKVRGAILCDTDKGLLLLKETRMEESRICALAKIYEQLNANGFEWVDTPLLNKEDAYVSKAEDGTGYILKKWFQGRECDVRRENELIAGAENLARIHLCMRLVGEENRFAGREENPVIKEYARHNRELRKVREFVCRRSVKSPFEIAFLKGYDQMYFWADRVLKILENMDLDSVFKEAEAENHMVHGDYNYHNLLVCQEGMAVTGFEHAHRDVQMEDLYYFLRKVLEKSGWKIRLGDGMLNAYSAIHPLTEGEMEYLKIRLIYPEKFWKTANSYYCTNKAWISVKNIEKLQTAIRQTEEKKMFLKEVFGFEL